MERVFDFSLNSNLCTLYKPLGALKGPPQWANSKTFFTLAFAAPGATLALLTVLTLLLWGVENEIDDHLNPYFNLGLR